MNLPGTEPNQTYMNTPEPFQLPSLKSFTAHVPRGAWLKEKNNILNTGARIFIPSMGLILLPIIAGGVLGLEYTFRPHVEINAVWVFRGMLMAVSLFCAGALSFYLFGKVQFVVRNGILSYRKSVFGIGMWRRMQVTSLTRIYLRTMRQLNRLAGPYVISNGVTDCILLVQGSEEWSLGQSVKPHHAQFMKEVLKAWVKQIPGVQLFEAPPPANKPQRSGMMRRTPNTTR